VPEEAEFLADNLPEESGQAVEEVVLQADKAQAVMAVCKEQDNSRKDSTRGSNSTMLIDYNNLQRRMLLNLAPQCILLSEKLH